MLNTESRERNSTQSAQRKCKKNIQHRENREKINTELHREALCVSVIKSQCPLCLEFKYDKESNPTIQYRKALETHSSVLSVKV